MHLLRSVQDSHDDLCVAGAAAEVAVERRKGLVCLVTERGQALYKEVMPIAQRS
jgi:hypothetical protein